MRFSTILFMALLSAVAHGQTEPTHIDASVIEPIYIGTIPKGYVPDEKGSRLILAGTVLNSMSGLLNVFFDPRCYPNDFKSESDHCNLKIHRMFVRTRYGAEIPAMVVSSPDKERDVIFYGAGFKNKD